MNQEQEKTFALLELLQHWADVLFGPIERGKYRSR